MWVNFVLRINALKELLNWIGIYNKSNGWNVFNTILGMVYDFLPFMILPIYTTISKIDKSYLEASKDLGANGATAFLKVTAMKHRPISLTFRQVSPVFLKILSVCCMI